MMGGLQSATLKGYNLWSPRTIWSPKLISISGG